MSKYNVGLKSLLMQGLSDPGWAYCGLPGGFRLLRNFSGVAISVSPHICFILVLILISMFLN